MCNTNETINFNRITGHCYSVKNQNSFNQALYDYFKESSYSKHYIRSMVQVYPKSYPTTIIIVDLSFECNRIFIEEFNLFNESNNEENLNLYRQLNNETN